MSVGILLMVIAFVLFVLAAVGVNSRINLVAAGLAAWALSILLGNVRP